MRLVKLFAALALFSGLARAEVVALAPHIVENLYAIGAGDEILATTEHSDFPAQALKLPRIGNYVSLQIEKILALNPDYVIVWRNGNPPTDLARLEQLGFTLVDSNPEKLADVAHELRQLGALLDHKAKGEQLAQQFETRLKAIKGQYEHKVKLKVFYELWPEPLTTVAKGSWPHQVLELCGVENLFADLKGEYPMISYESVLAAQPDVIIQPRDSARQIPATDWSKWAMLKAVKKQALLHPDADQLHRMTARMLDEAELLCQQLDRLRTQ